MTNNLHISPILPTFEASNILNGATRSTLACSGFLLVLIQGNPFALSACRNSVPDSLTRSGCLTAGSKGAFLFHFMSNIQTEKERLEHKVQTLETLVETVQTTNRLQAGIIDEQSGLVKAYHSAFSITQEEYQHLSTLKRVLERLLALPVAHHPFQNSSNPKSNVS